MSQSISRIFAQEKEKKEKWDARNETRMTQILEHGGIARANRSREIVQRSNVGYGDGPRIVFVYLGQCRPAMNKQRRSFFETI